MTAHREQLKDYLGKIHLKDVTVADWGSGAKPAMRYIQHDNCKFITIDNNKLIVADRRAPHHIVADLNIPLELTDTVDVAFCIEVIEHVANTDMLMMNIYDNLVEGGTLYISAPFLFPIHAEEDYWRFTENGLRLLLDISGFSIQDLYSLEGQSGYIAKAVKK